MWEIDPETWVWIKDVWTENHMLTTEAKDT